jgi:hypothetical protein
LWGGAEGGGSIGDPWPPPGSQRFASAQPDRAARLGMVNSIAFCAAARLGVRHGWQRVEVGLEQMLELMQLAGLSSKAISNAGAVAMWPDDLHPLRLYRRRRAAGLVTARQ